MQHQERYWQAKMVTLLGGVINILLGCIKIVGGIFFHSHALIADGVHSFSDLIIDTMVLFASKYGSQDADDNHPYGHQRIETASTLILALVLILAGAGIIWDSIYDLLLKQHSTPAWLSLPIAALSIIANEGLFHYTRHVGQRIHSDLIIANAWHRRSDAASSIVVLVGLIGSMAGFGYLDAIAAIVVGCMIINMGKDYGWDSVKELVDTAVEPQMFTTITKVIADTPGVKKIHQLRSRMMGRDIYIDVHIQVCPFISVSEGHFIAQHVHHALVKTIPKVKDVTVHVDPEDDEIASPCLHLPSRALLEHDYLTHWQQDYPGIKDWVIHYLDGKLTLDLLCDPAFDKWGELVNRVKHDLSQDLKNTHLRLFSQHQI